MNFIYSGNTHPGQYTGWSYQAISGTHWAAVTPTVPELPLRCRRPRCGVCKVSNNSWECICLPFAGCTSTRQSVAAVWLWIYTPLASIGDVTQSE